MRLLQVSLEFIFKSIKKRLIYRIDVFYFYQLEDYLENFKTDRLSNIFAGARVGEEIDFDFAESMKESNHEITE